MNFFISLISCLLLLLSSGDDPQALLKKAQAKMRESKYIHYNYTALWPNPADIIDTLSGSASFSRQQRTYSDYDYVGTEKGRWDLVYINNDFKQAEHAVRTVILFTPEDLKKNKSTITDNLIVKNSPLRFLAKTSWKYVRDTTWQGNAFASYRITEKDTVVEGNHIKVELYSFINYKTALLERYERRAFYNDKPSQIITYLFSDYELGNTAQPLTYALPANYKSQVGLSNEKKVVLKAGERAPSFSLPDLQGTPTTFDNWKGKKVLLVFSTINCGYCKLAIDHFNRKGYQLAPRLEAAYIFPDDSEKNTRAFVNKVPIPFVTMAGAKETGTAYGVSGYPTFFLVNEQGVIEKVMEGYQKEFMESLQK